MTDTTYLKTPIMEATQSQKEVTFNDEVDVHEKAICAPLSVSISTTTPVVLSQTTQSTRAVQFTLDPAGSPPVAGFTVEFPAVNRGFVIIKNNTLQTATIKVTGQVPAAATLGTLVEAIYFVQASQVKLVQTVSSGGGLDIAGLTEDTQPDGAADFVPTYDASAAANKKAKIKNLPVLESFIIAVSDETTALATGTAKVTFRMPYAFKVTAVRASLVVAQTSGSIFTVDINESGTTIISTKLTLDNTEKTSQTAITPAVISDADLADDAEMSVDIDQIGDGTAKGLKITLIGYKVL